MSGGTDLLHLESRNEMWLAGFVDCGVGIFWRMAVSTGSVSE